VVRARIPCVECTHGHVHGVVGRSEGRKEWQPALFHPFTVWGRFLVVSKEGNGEQGRNGSEGGTEAGSITHHGMGVRLDEPVTLHGFDQVVMIGDAMETGCFRWSAG